LTCLELKTIFNIRAEMIVCHCKGITCGDVEKAVEDGRTTARAVARSLGAGSGCGTCYRTLVKLVRQKAKEQRELELQAGLAEPGLA